MVVLHTSKTKELIIDFSSLEAADMELYQLTACQKGPTVPVFPKEAETGPAHTETVCQLL